MVLARWGGLGHHRYQVGFSGDVKELTWANLAYQPYFSATAANVLFPSWSHDIEGSPDDLEMFTRWLQVGAFSGTMRSHERGMSAGDCADKPEASPAAWGPNSGKCAVVEPWNTGPNFFEANRRALQWRARLVPYIYTAHRQLFDTGVGLMQPLYYHYPNHDAAYRMTASQNAQYFFGNSIMVAPITEPAAGDNGDPTQSLASKEVWMPPGVWFDALTGELSTVTTAHPHTIRSRGYTLAEVPMWFKGGAVVPYVPLRSMPSLTGVASQQNRFLGFRVIPGGVGSDATSGLAYEDDGTTTAYLTGAFVETHCNVTVEGERTEVSIATRGNLHMLKGFPAARAYQLQFPNALPPRNVTIRTSTGSEAVPFVRFGAVASSRQVPPRSQWYYSFEEDEGLVVVVDLVDIATAATVVVSLSTAADPQTTAALHGGLFGTLIRAVYAHANQDVDRTNPDENSPGPAYLSQLSSVGVALEKLADPMSPTHAFGALVAKVPALLANATQELQGIKKPNGRVVYTLALLQ